jgi:hypothetical protein
MPIVHTYPLSSGATARYDPDHRQRVVALTSVFIDSGLCATRLSMTRAAIRSTPLVLRRLWRKANSSK